MKMSTRSQRLTPKKINNKTLAGIIGGGAAAVIIILVVVFSTSVAQPALSGKNSIIQDFTSYPDGTAIVTTEKGACPMIVDFVGSKTSMSLTATTFNGKKCAEYTDTSSLTSLLLTFIDPANEANTTYLKSWMEVKFYISEKPYSQGAFGVQFRCGNSVLCSINFNLDGSVALLARRTFNDFLPAKTMSMNAWHTLRCSAYLSDTLQSAFKLTIDGNEYTTAVLDGVITPFLSQGSTPSSISRVMVYLTNGFSSGTGTALITDVASSSVA